MRDGRSRTAATTRGERRASPHAVARGLAGQYPGVVLPAICETDAGKTTAHSCQIGSGEWASRESVRTARLHTARAAQTVQTARSRDNISTAADRYHLRG